MSSLGDLLLGKTRSRTPSPSTDGHDRRDDSPSQSSNLHNVPKISSNKLKDDREDEVQSNASSTDDYVRELLDPNDRPRNVWHVVEGPKSVSHDGQSAASREDRSHDDDYISPPDTPNHKSKSSEKSYGDHLEEDSLSHHDPDHEDYKDDKKADRLSEKSDRSRERSKNRSSSGRDHQHRTRDDSDRRRDRDRDRGKHRDRDHRRSDRSRRRVAGSDDEEDDHDRKYTSSRRHRSRSRGSPRRSKSNSQSPITKRNSRTILIMQLSPRVRSRDLEDYFRDIGRVREVRLIMDSKTKRHKGIAYIEFDDARSASKALALNGQKFHGNPMLIQSALMDKGRGSTELLPSSTSSQSVNYQPPTHSSSRSNLPPNSYRVYVGSLHIGITDDMLRSLFEPFGPILRLELMKDRATNVSRGYAFITYANAEDGQFAVQTLDGIELGGKCIRVSKSTEKNEQSSSS